MQVSVQEDDRDLTTFISHRGIAEGGACTIWHNGTMPSPSQLSSPFMPLHGYTHGHRIRTKKRPKKRWFDNIHGNCKEMGIVRYEA